MNVHVTSKLLLQGTITASGDLVSFLYIVDLLMGCLNSRAVTKDGREAFALEALCIAGVWKQFELALKEGLALVNGTAVGSALAFTMSYNANIMVFLAKIMLMFFYEAIQGKPEFTNLLTCKLKHHHGQILAAAIMKADAKFNETNPLRKPKLDRDALLAIQDNTGRSTSTWILCEELITTDIAGSAILT